ncbi:SMC family ATPase [Borrelia sp. BU AG58]|uniref:AAA family ATPase n=1 Tax=Borrelia sp. BU AG58 TaxID=2887345 RepID=UPI001E6182AA|nr:SMC family ATPase [Borrelia sp. BU AG58]UER67971.1 SMC family ATPase [Borrelia sp. BU AG58]
MVLGGRSDLKKKNSLLFSKRYYLREEQGNMRINKLVFKNIASYKGEYEIDFDVPVLKNSGIFLISGNTGSGKSTILDCITLALYARVYRLGGNISDAISKGFDNAYVRLTFTVSDKVYESFVELSTKQKKTPSNMILKDLKADGYIENREDALAYINSLCRLNFEQFCQTVILPQGNFQEFLTSKPKSKTAIIDNIFNLKKYDDIEIFLKREFEFTNLNRNKLKILETEEKNRIDINSKKLDELTNFLNSVDIERLRMSLKKVHKLILMCDKTITINQKYLDIKNGIDNLESEVFSKIQSKKRLDYEYYLHENDRAKVEERLKFYNSCEFFYLGDCVKKQSELLSDKSRFSSELSIVQTDLGELEYLNLDRLNFDYIKELYYENVLFSEIGFDGNAYEKLNVEKRQMEKGIKELSTERDRKSVELKSVTLGDESFDLDKYVYYKALNLFRCFNEELILKYGSELDLLLKSKDMLQNAGLNVKIDLYKKFLKDLGDNKESIEKDIEGLKSLEDEYRAHQRKKHLKTNSLDCLLELNTKIQVLQDKLDTVKTCISEERENKIRWENQILEFNKKNAEILKRIGNDLFGRYIDYSDKNKILIFENKLRKVEILKTASSDLNSKIALKDLELKENLDKVRILSSNNKLNLSLENPVLLQEEFENFLRNKKKLENEYLKLDSVLSDINNSKLKLESQIELMDQRKANLSRELEDELTKFDTNFSDLKGSMEDNFDVQGDIFSFDSLKPSRDSLDYFLDLKPNFIAKIELLSKDISKYESAFSSLQVLKDELIEQKTNLENIQRELSSVNERNEKLEILKKVITVSPSLKYYVQSFLIEEILGISNKRYLSVILPEFELQINTESRDFDFLVKSKRDGNMTRNVKTLSGGEKFLVSLSLSLALSDMIRDSELKIEAFFLDEGFGSLDEDTLKMVISKISEFQRIDGRQIGIISHVAYLKEEIKARIIVSKILKISSIVIESS